MKTLRCLLIALIPAFIPLAAGAAQTIFTTSSAIDSGDATYDGQDIVVVGCTLTVAGPHSFNSLQVLAGGLVKHPATTASTQYSLNLTLAGNLLIDTNSAIDASGLGYPADYTFGGAVEGASTGYSGGSYGGFGAPNSGTANNVYGDYRNPNELGSGGADINEGGGGAGGGLIRITAASAQVDGKILANGQTPVDCGAGSGGGIYLNVAGTLSGVGLIAANGGTANGWNGTPGGGGRVAVYYTAVTNFNLLTNVTAHSGGGAGVGTVYLVQAGQAGQLLIASHGTSTGFWTPLGLTTDTVLQADSLVLSGANVVAAPASQMEVQAGSISVLNGAVLTHQAATLTNAYSLLLTITNTLLVDSNSAIDVTGRGYLPDHTLGGAYEGEPAGYSGGSYGGLGAANLGTPVAVYGDYHNPNELGSGGSDISEGGGGAGGGLIRITAASAQVDGKILANGQTPTDCGSGSGGGIYLNVGTLSGAGLIAANGGIPNGWNGTSGGGGRVAVYYGTGSGFNLLTNVTAHAGGVGAAVGTIFLQPAGGLGQVLITSHGTAAGQWTPLGQATDTVFAADSLVVSGGNVLVAPLNDMPIQAGSLQLLGGAVLTHLASTASQTYSLQLNISNSLYVDTNSAIDVSAKGYPADYSSGGTLVGGSVGYSGGSYGGLGAANHGTPNAVYGDYHNPNDLGSGGGDVNAGGGGAGGGLVRITAPTVQIDGAIRANGQVPSQCGSGSGGGIFLQVGTLLGAGSISANGGAANGWNGTAGGGGRVAVLYGGLASSNQFDLVDGVTALEGGGGAAVGTVYLQQTGQPGQLRIDSHGTAPGEWTQLGVATNGTLAFDNLILSGPGVMAVAPDGLPITAQSLSLLNGAVLTHPAATSLEAYSLQLVVSNLVIDAASKIDVSGRGYIADYTVSNAFDGDEVGFSGGSYGGLGGFNGATANPVYGDYRNPSDLGSGGGDAPYGGGGAGGGLVQITATNALIDGKILAEGQTPNQCGAGSGGGVLLNIGALSGQGQISVDGGSANGWNGTAGGGGRVAIYYGTVTNFDLLDDVTAHSGGAGAAVGTVFLQPAGGPGQLLVTSHGTPAGQWTPLGRSADAAIQVDDLEVSGTNVVVAPQYQMPILASNLWVVSGATLTHQPVTPASTFSLEIGVTNLILDAASSINVSTRGYPADYTVGDTNVGELIGYSGGSYGGLGGANTGNPNPVYGDYRNPNDWGSGGGDITHGGGGAGGGLIRISAALAQLDGTLLANGQVPSQCGAGSGGGILLVAGTLGGSGLISANGAPANGWNGTPGGGGRVAIYYTTLNGFDFSTNVTAHSGGAAGVGTVFLQQAGSLGELLITSHGTAAGQWTPLGQSTDTVFQADSLVVSGANVVAAPAQEMAIEAGSVSLLNGATLTHQPATASQTYSLQMTITNGLVIDTNSAIDVSSRGYLRDTTQGDSSRGASTGYSGGSYGGLGGANNGVPNPTYGDYHNPDDLGSGGADVGSSGAGAGGGLIRITAASAQVDGKILADGQVPSQCGAGSGGGILLNAGTLNGVGVIAADGGAPNGWNGTAGGGGRIAVFTWAGLGMPADSIHANAGGAGAAAGTVYLGLGPWLGFDDVSMLWHGSETIAWSTEGLPAGQGSTEISVSRNGVTYLDQVVTGATGTLPWNSAQVPDGLYTLSINVRNASGQVVGQISQTELVNNSVIWQGGTLSGSQTWSTSAVQVVAQNVIIPSGVTLTIPPGAIVKFAKDVGIVIQNGGTLNVLGTSNAPIVLTSLADDTAGGDTNEDGNQSVPQPGDWSGITVVGVLNQNSFVQIRYAAETEGGALTQNEEWVGSSVHLVQSTVTVPTGLALTLDAGAVVKFAAGAGLVVQAGGTLNAPGTVAQPIILTSFTDDSVGGDGSSGGAETTPEPGDWVGLSILGQATLNHCDIRYGGNTGSGAFASGVLIVDDGSLVLSNSIVESTFYDGISVYGATGNALLVNSVLYDTDRAIWAWGGGNVLLVNCTFDQNLAGLDNHGGGVIEAENCIIANSIEGSSIEGAVTLRYCDLWSDYPGSVNPSVIGQNGNISADPKFVNENLQDFQLNYGSPCINSADATVAPPLDASGSPLYNDPRTVVKTGVPNTNGIYADMGAFSFVETAPSDVDLVATTVSGPDAVTAGEVVEVQWTVANIGTGIATGPWHDTVSLVSSSDTNDIFTLGVALEGQGAVLGPGQTYAAWATFQVPGATAGNYLWQAHVNSSGDVYEGANWTNNITTAAEPTSLSVPALALGSTTSSNLLSSSSPYQWYEFVATSNADILISVNLASTTGSSAQLFVGAGYMPTPQHYDFMQSQFSSSSPTVAIPAVAGQTYYILIYGQALPSGESTFTLQAQALNFGVSSINPTNVGNAGAVTFEIVGAQLETNAVVEIISPASVVQEALTNYIASSALAYATFDLSNAVTGLWNLRVSSGGFAVTLTNAFEVVAGGGPNLTAEIVGNNVIRAGLSYNYTLTYNNAGNGDAYYPLIFVVGVPTSATVTLGPEFVSPAQPLNVPPTNSLYVGTGDSLTMTPLAINRLRPGEGGSATFTINVPVGTGQFNVTPEVLGPAVEPLPNSYFSTNAPGGAARPQISLPCSVDTADLPGAAFLLGLAFQYGATGNWALGGWAKSGHACVEEAAFMKGIYDSESLLTSSPSSGWTFTVVTKNGFVIGHTTVLATSPSGNSYIIDNYVVPTIVPMRQAGDGQWQISPSCYIFPFNEVNPFVGLDSLITAAGGGLYWTPLPTEPQDTCPIPKPKTLVPVTPKSSYDPNLKVGPDTGTPEGYVSAQQPLTYQIDFANEANASAPAQEVTVTDSLSTNLDWSTLRLQTIGFNGVTLAVPSGAQAFTARANVSTDPNPVQVEASLNASTGLVTWNIESIDPATGQLVEDPLAGFLPPDNAQGAGEGYVSYTIQPKAGLPSGAVIYNQATIVFDANPPIATGTVTNTIDATPPTSAISPLPATSQPTFTVSWSGADPWSGVASFNIYASTNGRAWGPWLLGTTNTSATFTGVSGDTYAFYSVAIDQVGNIELSPTIPGAQTTVGGAVQGPLLSHVVVSDGQFQFTLNITSTNSFVVQASTDLKTWLPLLTNQAPFTFVDTNSARSGWRFYRTQTLP
jgi:hypothetical protein